MKNRSLKRFLIGENERRLIFGMESAEGDRGQESEKQQTEKQEETPELDSENLDKSAENQADDEVRTNERDMNAREDRVDQADDVVKKDQEEQKEDDERFEPATLESVEKGFVLRTERRDISKRLGIKASTDDRKAISLLSTGFNKTLREVQNEGQKVNAIHNAVDENHEHAFGNIDKMTSILEKADGLKTQKLNLESEGSDDESVKQRIEEIQQEIDQLLTQVDTMLAENYAITDASDVMLDEALSKINENDKKLDEARQMLDMKWELIYGGDVMNVCEPPPER